MSRLRIRTLKPEFFEDAKICSIPLEARYVTIGLITRADDRGRQQRQDQAILGYIFPDGDVSPKALQKWLSAIISAGIVLDYAHGGRCFLWFPNFWRHQKINRPSESDCPPHPDDSLGSLPITQAIEVWRSADAEHPMSRDGSIPEDSVINHETLTPSRAGAHSAPLRSRERTSSKGKDEVDARARSKTVDQDAPPAALVEELKPTAEKVLGVLVGAHAERGGNLPTLRGVGLAVAAFPDRDHLAVAGELEHWALAGNGQRRVIRDWAATYRRFLTNAPAGAPARPASPRGLVGVDVARGTREAEEEMERRVAAKPQAEGDVV